MPHQISAYTVNVFCTRKYFSHYRFSPLVSLPVKVNTRVRAPRLLDLPNVSFSPQMLAAELSHQRNGQTIDLNLQL